MAETNIICIWSNCVAEFLLTNFSFDFSCCTMLFAFPLSLSHVFGIDFSLNASRECEIGAFMGTQAKYRNYNLTARVCGPPNLQIEKEKREKKNRNVVIRAHTQTRSNSAHTHRPPPPRRSVAQRLCGETISMNIEHSRRPFSVIVTQQHQQWNARVLNMGNQSHCKQQKTTWKLRNEENLHQINSFRFPTPELPHCHRSAELIRRWSRRRMPNRSRSTLDSNTISTYRLGAQEKITKRTIDLWKLSPFSSYYL